MDGYLTLTESSAILRYLNDRYGEGRFSPKLGTTQYYIHEQWLDYVESSAALPAMITLLGKTHGGTGEPMQDFCNLELAKTFRYIAEGLDGKPFLTGDDVMLADIQMSYFLAMSSMAGVLEQYPTLSAYYDRLCAQPGFLRAVEKGGPMVPPAGI